MRIAVASLVLFAAVGLDPGAWAAEPPAPAAHSDAMAGPGKMAGGMMGGGMMDMHACLSDARLAALKADLKLTPAQLPLWNAFVEATKAGPYGTPREMGMMQGGSPGSGMMMGSGPLPERLAQHEKLMTAHLEALRKVRAAVTPLYDALTPDQKAKADRLLCGGQMGAAQS